jgi:hypothetical protein
MTTLGLNVQITTKGSQMKRNMHPNTETILSNTTVPVCIAFILK